MVDPKNNGVIIGGLVADPELVNDGKIAKLRVAVDFAGKDAAKPENKSGYFDAVMYDNGDQASDFTFRQIREGKMKKGSQVGLVYRLSHQRWQSEDGPRQRIELVAEAITYVGGGARKEESEATSESSEEASTEQAAVAGAQPKKF
jgi:single-stranded DNA-binding protein